MPFAQLADAVGPRTTAVACSHVNWRTGEIAPAALAEVDVPVILDGAQGAGAVPVDVVKLGCAAYAAAGQKWLCGADGTGLLYVAPGFRDRVRAIAPSYLSFEDASLGFDSPLKPDARRHDTPSLSRESHRLQRRVARACCARPTSPPCSRAARRWPRRWPSGSPPTAARSRRATTPRSSPSRTTTRRPRATACYEAGVLVRNLPGTPLVRASVGAWSSEDDLERLLAAL